MATAGEIGIRLSIKDGQVVSAALGRVGQDIDGLKAPAQRASASLGDLQSALAGIVTVGGAMAIIKIADSVTTLNTQLKLSSSSAHEAQAAYDGLFQIAQRTRTSFTELGSTYATFARAGSDLGVSQTRLLKVTESIGSAIAISGGNAASAQAALVQLGQGLASGTLRGEELNSVMEQTPRLAKALADGMGVSIGALRSLGEQGKLTADAVISALEKSGPKLAEEMKSATLTVGQSLTVLQNSFANAVGEIDKASHATGTIAGALKDLSGVIDSVGAAAKNNPGATAFIVGLGQGAAGIAATTAAVYGLSVAFGALGAAARAHPVILAFSAFAAAGMALKQYSDQQRKTAEGLRETIALYDQQNKVLAVLKQKSDDYKDGNKNKITKDAAKQIDEGISELRAKLPELRTAAEEAKAALAELNAAKAGPTQANVRAVDNELAANADAAKFAGAKAIDEARKLAKLRTDIIKQGQEDEKTLRASFAKTIKDADVKSDDTGIVDAAKTHQKKLELQQELDQRLLAQKRETTAALKSFDEAQAKPGQDASKLRLEKNIAEFERAQTASQEYFKNQEEEAKSAYDRGVMDYAQYVKRKEAIDLAANDYSAQIASGELAAVQRSGLAKKDRIAQELKLVEELESIAAKRVNISQKAANDIREAEDKAYKQGIEANAKMLESQQDLTNNLQAQLKDRERANAEIGLSAKAIDELRSKTMELNAVELERRAGVHADPQIAAEYRAQAVALRGLIFANAEGIAKASAVAEFSATWQSVDKTAHDVFVNIFDGGQDAFTKLGNVLKSTLLDLLYQMTVRKWVFDITASVTGNAGATLTGNAINFASGVGGSSVAGASGLSSVLNGASLAVSTFGSNALEAAKAVTVEGASFGEVVSTISNEFAAGKFAAGVGGAVGAIAPYAIAAVAAKSLFDAMQGSVTPTGTFLYGGQGRFGGRQDFAQSGGLFGGGNTKNSSWFDPAPEVATYMGAVEGALVSSVKGWADAIGLSADAVDSYSKQVEVSIGGLDAKGTKEAIDKAFSGFAESLTQATYGLSVDTLKTLATNLTGVNAVFEAVGVSALDASMGGAELATSIVTAAGSLDNLGKLTGAAYEALATPAQKAANSAAQLDKAFAALGVSTPKTVQDLAKLAQAQDLTSDAGRRAAVGILSLLPALEQVQASAKSVREAMLKDAGINNGDIASVVKKGLIEGTLQNAGGEISDVVMAGIQDALYGRMADAITSSFTDEMLAPLLDAMQKGKSLPEALAAVDWSQVKSKFQRTVDEISSIFDNAQITSGIGALKGSIQDLFSTASYSVPKGWILTQETAATRAATGGRIVGPGTGTSDSITTMLSNGEFVVKAASATKYSDRFLNAVNDGTFVEPIYRATGGYVWDDPAAYQDWQALSGAGNVPVANNSGYYENGLIADSRNASSATTDKPDYSSLESDAASTYIDALRAMGETYTANTLALQKATEGFDALHVAMYREIEAGKQLVSMRETLTQSQKSYAQLGVDLLKARGDTTGAAAAQRGIDLADATAQRTAASDRLLQDGLSENEKSYQAAIIATANLTIAQYDLTKAREKEIAIANERKGLQDQLDNLTMTSTQLLDKQRNALDASNQSLFDQIQAATKAKQVADERKGLQDQLDNLTMTSTQLLDKQRNALDASNQALFDQIQAASKAAEITKTNAGWQDKLALAKDPSRQREIEQRNALSEATDETTKGLINEYYAQLDANDAAQAAAAAATALAQSYAGLKNQIEQANIELAKASGLDAYAEELQTALDLREHAGDTYYESLYRELQTIRKLTDARQKLNTLEDSALKSQISLKRAQGEGILANALERSSFLANAALPAAQAKAELDRSNLSWGTFAAQKNVGVSPQYEGMASYLADLASQGHSIQGYLYNDAANNGVALPSNLRDALNEFAQTRRTDTQKASLQSVVDTSAEIAAAYDRNKALEGELKIIELQDEAMKQYLDSQNAVKDAQKSYADVLKSTIETMRDFIETLDGGASPLQNLSTARNNFQEVAGRAAAGDTSAYKDLTPAARAFLDLSKNYSRSIQDYQRDEARVRTTLNAVIKVNQFELDKLPKEIAEAADPTKQAWVKLQEALNKEANASVVLTALQVDQDASKRRLRTAEETLADRYIEAVYLLDETKKTSLLKAFNTAIQAKVDETTLPDYSQVFDLGDIWSDNIGAILPNEPLTNEQLNALIAEKFPGLLPSDFVTALTPTQLSELVSGKFPTLTPENLIGVPADMVGAVNAKLDEILPADFAGPAFNAQAMMQAAINSAMATITGSIPAITPPVTQPPPNIAPDIGTPFVLPVDPPSGTGAVDWAGLTAAEAAARLGISEIAAMQPHYLSAILATYTEPSEYAYQKSANPDIDQKIADLKAYGHAKGFPGFAVGTNNVPHDMLALIHKDEAIIPAPFNPERYAKASGNTVLVEKIQALTAEVARLQKVLEAGQNAIKENTGKTARMLTRLDEDGVKLRT